MDVMKVFDRGLKKSLRGKYKSKSKYVTPYIVRLALDSRLSRERKKIERWFQDLPESIKPDIRARLRSEISQQHFGAYYELVTHEFFKKLGYSVEMHPSFGNEEPDLLVSGMNLDKPIVTEVATVFDDPEWEKEDRKLRELLNQLDNIKHLFFLGITVALTPVSDNIDYDSLRQFVTQWFDSFDPKVTEDIQTTSYDRDGLKLSLNLIPKKPKFRKKKGPIIGIHGLPARFISNQQMRNALKKKASKYKFVKEQGYPYIVALSLYSTHSDSNNVIDQLLGKHALTISRDAEGHLVNKQWGRDSSGICRYNQNTRLSGVVTIKSESAIYTSNNRLIQKFVNSRIGQSFQQRFPDIIDKPARVHRFSLIRNPYAAVPLNDDLMNGYPRFKKTGETTNSSTYSWVDEQSNLPFD